MKSLLAFLTLSLALVMTAGCAGKASFEKDFRPETARDVRVFHESLKGSTELLGEAATSVALAVGDESSVDALDDALTLLTAADINAGNADLIDSVSAVNAASRAAVPASLPSGRMSAEQIANLQEAYIYAAAALELNESGSAAAGSLASSLDDEMIMNPKSIAKSNQLVELIGFARGAMTHQQATATSIVEMVSAAAASNNFELAGPEQTHAMRRTVAPSTTK